MVNQRAKFLPDITNPLHELLLKKKLFCWGTAQQCLCYCIIISIMKLLPPLIYPRMG